MIAHLRKLGVTAIELLPVHAFLDDRRLRRAGPAQLLGLQHAQLLFARAALQRRQCHHRFPRHGGGAARCRHRGDPRRGLQPHLRGQSSRPHAVLSRHRQCLLLLADARQPALLRKLHRHRQCAQADASARAADGDGFAAALGRGLSMSTASASISPPRWAASRDSIATRRSSPPSGRTRCSATSS